MREIRTSGLTRGRGDVSLPTLPNCGLPYYVGRVIVREDDLLVATPELFRERFNIDVRTECNVEAVDPLRRRLRVRHLATGKVENWEYDALVLAPGSAPIRPRLPGVDLDGIFTLWTIPDTRRILEWIRSRKVGRAMVVGGGFIGLDPEGKRWPYAKIYIHPDRHAGYYPDAQTLTLKLIFDRTDGRILGAQAVDKEGVDKRIDVIATHLQHRGTVFDLEVSELCYAPQYGSAKDPVNQAGMVAANFLRGDMPTVYWEDLPGADVFKLDVRTAEEYASGHVPGAVNIPIDELRPRLDELPGDREIWSYCYVGQRSYVGVRMMLQHGFNAKNLTGGFRMYTMID